MPPPCIVYDDGFDKVIILESFWFEFESPANGLFGRKRRAFLSKCGYYATTKYMRCAFVVFFLLALGYLDANGQPSAGTIKVEIKTLRSSPTVCK